MGLQQQLALHQCNRMVDSQNGNGWKVKDRDRESDIKNKEGEEEEDEVQKPMKTLQSPYIYQEKVCLLLIDVSMQLGAMLQDGVSSFQ